MKPILLVAIIFMNFSSFAQTDCACCDETHKQFDFWAGNWNVYDTLDQLIGKNQIVHLEDHCILNENWVGGKGSTGKSYNYFDKSDSTWNQVWIDNKGNPLVLKGNWNGESMILKGKLIEGQNIRYYRNVVSWTPNKDGSVIQLWEIRDENDNVLKTIFKGIYKKQ